MSDPCGELVWHHTLQSIVFRVVLETSVGYMQVRAMCMYMHTHTHTHTHTQSVAYVCAYIYGPAFMGIYERERERERERDHMHGRIIVIVYGALRCFYGILRILHLR